MVRLLKYNCTFILYKETLWGTDLTEGQFILWKHVM